MKTSPSLLLVTAVALLGSTVSSEAANTVHPGLKGDLVASEGKRLSKFDDTPLGQAKYYGIYYSAAWCGPCRAFTPDLVQWYKRHKKANPHFEMIFVSSDRSEDDMAKYMKDDDMPWPALDFSRKAKSPLAKYSAKGIPCLVLIDEEGKVLSHSYEGDKYVGPRKVLEDIEKTLKANPASAEAKAAAATTTGKVGTSSFDEAFKKKPAAQ
jgi:nucleoredoxin